MLVCDLRVRLITSSDTNVLRYHSRCKLFSKSSSVKVGAEGATVVSTMAVFDEFVEGKKQKKKLFLNGQLRRLVDYVLVLSCFLENLTSTVIARVL